MNHGLDPDIVNFIEAKKKVEEAKYQLHRAENHLGTCNRALSNIFFGEGSNLPEKFVVHYDGQFYLIRVDAEGDHGHTMERIDAVMWQIDAMTN